ncbi:MAG: hypothetical protein ACRBFS_01575 [Aureispira sp.]
MEQNILYIEHQEFGKEQFKIALDARYNIYNAVDEEEYEDEDEPMPDLWEFVFYLRTEAVLLEGKGLEGHNARPNVEATVLLTSVTKALAVGQVLTQEKGYDYDRDEHLSNVYYFNHSNIENLQIEILEMTADDLLVQLEGAACINGSNGNAVDAVLKAKLRLRKDEGFERTLS